MLSLKTPAIIALVALAVPVTAAAFGFGATQYDYPPPWGPYAPYPGAVPQPGYGPGGYPLPGPPPGARDVRGMFGTGPGMKWGNRDRDAQPKEPEAKPYERLHQPWQWGRPWPNSQQVDQVRERAAERRRAMQESAKAISRPTWQPYPQPNFSPTWSQSGQPGMMYPGWEQYQNPPEAVGK